MPLEVSIVENDNGPNGPYIDFDNVSINWPTDVDLEYSPGAFSGVLYVLDQGHWNFVVSDTPGQSVSGSSILDHATFYNVFDDFYIVIEFKDSGVTVGDITDGFSNTELLSYSPIINGVNPDPDPFGATNGDDILLGTRKSDEINGLKGDDTISGRKGNDKLKGGDGADILRGDAGRDKLNGEQGRDKLLGGDGADLLKGGLGGDLLIGGRGNDTLLDEHGNDRMKGGAGADLFLFKERVSDGRDKILDFNPDEDIIRVKLSAHGPFSAGDTVTGTALRDHLLNLGTMISFTEDKIVVGNGGSKLTVLIDGVTTEEAYWNANEFLFS